MTGLDVFGQGDWCWQQVERRVSAFREESGYGILVKEAGRA